MQEELKFESTKSRIYASEHYLFHFQSGSFAEKEIEKIAKEQERAYSKICNTLGIGYSEKINYYFTDNPVEIGHVIWQEESPCNGVAFCGENKIYAVYTEKIQCIGCHEDTHLISYSIGCPSSIFIIEGLAMYMDEVWWDISNEKWSAYYKEKMPEVSIKALLCNENFYDTKSEIAYPIAGAFTRFLVDTYGMEVYKEFYKQDSEDYEVTIQQIFGKFLNEIESIFWEKMAKVPYEVNQLEDRVMEKMDGK